MFRYSENSHPSLQNYTDSLKNAWFWRGEIHMQKLYGPISRNNIFLREDFTYLSFWHVSHN